jgi:TRAP-type C4-dicarboxylate transport system substrate-binding protein
MNGEIGTVQVSILNVSRHRFFSQDSSMLCAARSFLVLSLAATFVLSGTDAWSAIDPEDQKLIDEASCPEIVREYRNYAAAEKKVDDQIRRSNAGMVAANVAGIAAFAALGFGFLTWDDNSDAQETLVELRDIRIAIAEGARKKGCAL